MGGATLLALVLAFGLPRPVARTLDAWRWSGAARVARGTAFDNADLRL